MWQLIGLVCSTVTCMWMAPAFDDVQKFNTQAECGAVAIVMRSRAITYTDLRCRKTDTPLPRARPRRME
jgi:hypothetical protein